MGYEEEISIVNKKKVEKITSMSPAEFADYFAKYHVSDDDDIADDLGSVETSGIYFPAVARMLDESRKYSFGKYYENSGEIIKLGKPLFTNEKMQQAFDDYSPYVIGMDAVANAIEFYRQRTAEYFRLLTLSDEEYKSYVLKHGCRYENQAKRISNAIKWKYEEWANKDLTPYSLTGPTSVNSWLIEYEIFALVDLYRNTDWDNEVGIFYGH